MDVMLTPLVALVVGMKLGAPWLRRMAKLGFLLMMGVSMSAEAGLFGFGGDSWKEEVLLHDGSKLVLQRSQSYGGRREVGQSAPIKEHTVSFALPGSGKTIAWTSEYSADVGRANFTLLAVHLVAGTPYVVAYPNLCLSYNKWGRPNPPYVIFKHDGSGWQRIPLEQLPSEIAAFNVVISLQTYDVDRMVGMGLVSAKEIAKLNGNLRQPELKTILREPVRKGTEGSAVNCEELVRYKDHWIMPNDPVARGMVDRKVK